MVKRSKKNQTCHNASVLSRAVGLETNGWNVRTDIRGFPKPRNLNGSRPDIYATKRGKTRMIEVETLESRFKDRKQHQKLRKYAKSRKNTTFMVRTCNPKKYFYGL